MDGRRADRVSALANAIPDVRRLLRAIWWHRTVRRTGAPASSPG